MRAIYLNNAATSYPKPPSVLEAVRRCLEALPDEPGRSFGGRNTVQQCRTRLATLFSVEPDNQIILLQSATCALNMVIAGLMQDGGHAITSDLAHNSVLRPLHHMALRHQASITFIEPDPEGLVTPDALRQAIRTDTRLIALCHADNVLGAIQPIHALAAVAAERGIPFLVDAAQSAGSIPIAYTTLPGRVFAAFAGHKGLLGPSGTGGLIVPDDRLRQTFFGGTGIWSELASHPESLPLRHEAGTYNLPGLAGLRAGVTHLLCHDVAHIANQRHELVGVLRHGLGQLPRVVLYPLAGGDGRAGIVSFNVLGQDPEEVGFTLYEAFGIHVRAGLHCAPRIHRHLDAADKGTVRVSLGPFNTMDDVDRFLTAMQLISKGGA